MLDAVSLGGRSARGEVKVLVRSERSACVKYYIEVSII